MNRAYFNGLKVVEQVKEDTAWIIEVDTTLAGVSDSDQFQFTGAEGEYDVLAFQSGVQVASFNNLVDEQTITLPSAGVFELRVIPKAAGFDKVRFNNGGDRLKLLKTLQWGDYGVNEPDQSRAFWGCENHSEIAADGKWFTVVTDGTNMLRTNGLTSLPSSMTLPNLTNGLAMLDGNNLSSLPLGMTLPSLTNGSFMLRNNSLTSLPSGMTLPSLTSGGNMFLGSTINTARYSQLLIDLEEFNPNNNVAFHGGNSQYNTQGETARNALTARGWTITDGGLE